MCVGVCVLGMPLDACVWCRVSYVAVWGRACCSVMLCDEVSCSVLYCVAVSCSVLQCAAVYSNVLQCVAACCIVLQCVAMCCSVLQQESTLTGAGSALHIILNLLVFIRTCIYVSLCACAQGEQLFRP